MCFAEYIAYQCGHTSIAVNRPCPMTTQIYNNPCCPRPATRPFMAFTMCFPCARIIHGRRLDIAEYEHYWMHVRGVCGCEIVFPVSQEPRLVQRPQFGTMKGAATSATPSSSHFKQGSSSTGKGGGGGQQHLKTNIPLFSEAQVGQHVEVAVRLPSVYAAEWTKDHSKLHENGKCKCPVSFERYKPIDVGVNDDEAVSPKTKNFKVPRPAYKGGYKPSFHKPARYPKAPTDPVPSGRSNTQTSSFGGSPASGHSAPLSGHNQVPVGHAARWALKGDPGSLLDQILGPVGPDPTAYGDRPIDIQTMHFQNDSVPIVGKPLACGELEEDALPSIVEFAQPEITLAGFPIGAGPEGDSHAGPWDTCSLYSSYSNLGDMPPRTRPLSTGF